MFNLDMELFSIIANFADAAVLGDVSFMFQAANLRIPDEVCH